MNKRFYSQPFPVDESIWEWHNNASWNQKSRYQLYPKGTIAGIREVREFDNIMEQAEKERITRLNDIARDAAPPVANVINTPPPVRRMKRGVEKLKMESI